MTTWKEFVEKQLEDPEFRREYERLGPLYSAITDALRLRYERGLTQAYVARRMGRQQPAVARFEAGNTNPTLSFLYDLAQALDATLTVHIEPREAVKTGQAPTTRRIAEAPKRYRSGSAEGATPLLGESEG